MEQRKSSRYGAAVTSDVQGVETPCANSSLNNPTHPVPKGAAKLGTSYNCPRSTNSGQTQTHQI